MMAISTFVHVLLFLLSINCQVFWISPVFLALLINAIMFTRIASAFGVKFTIHRMTRGEILPNTLYTIFLLLFPQSEHIYSLPLLLSNIGKCYIMLTTPDTLNLDLVENIIISQSKFQMGIVIYVFFKIFICLLTARLRLAIMFSSGLLLAIFKIKYEIHYGTRKAYEEIHFGLDRVSKALNIRGIYHVMHKAISKFGSSWDSRKQITY